MNELVFNGICNDEFDIKILNIDVEVFAGAKHKLLDVPGYAGHYLFPQKPKGRRIKVDCILEGSSLSDLSDKAFSVAAWLSQEDWKKLEVHTVPGKYFMAVVIDPVDPRQIIATRQFSIMFYAQAFAYGDITTNNFVNDTATINNLGTYPAPAIIEATFTDAATEFKVTLGTKYVRVVDDFVLNDTLKIDTSTGAVLINGTRAMDKLDWQNSIFFELAKGDNTLNITPTGKCTATVKHTPRWL